MTAHERIIQIVTAANPSWEAAEVADRVARAEEYFLGQTHRREIPATAVYLVADVAAYMASGEQAAVTSVKRGDTQISYGEGSTLGARLDGRIRSFAVGIAR